MKISGSAFLFRALVAVTLLSVFTGCNRAEKLSLEGITHLEAGRDTTALTFFEKALSIDPENSLALYGKGRLLLQQPITRSLAKEMLKKAIQGLKDPDVLEKAYIMLADAEYRDRNMPAALATLEKGRKAAPSVRISNNLAKYYVEMKDIEKAKTLLVLTLKDHAGDFDTVYNLAVLLASEFKDYEGAERYFMEANRLQPGQKDTLLNLVKISYLLKKKDQALNYLDAMVKLSINQTEIDQLANLKSTISKGRWIIRY